MASGDITRLLEDLKAGNPASADQLARLVYSELHRMARYHMRRERAGHSLQASDLVQKVYLRLIDQRQQNWANRAHFFGVAAHLMRLILLDSAKKNRAAKHGGGRCELSIDKVVLFSENQFEDLISLDQALTEFESINARAARVVEYRFFVGLTNEEIASLLDVSEQTVKRDWTAARLWLHRALARRVNSPEP